MASNIKVLRETVKAEWVADLMAHIESKEFEVLQTASNEFAVPVVDSEGGEHYVVITVKIPTGSRDGDAYDGYAAAEDYRMRQTAKAEKAAEKERKATERKAKKDK